jgi:hypothetical protein
MTLLTYPLVDGFVHNWLVVGPFVQPVSITQPVETPEATVSAVIRMMYQPEHGLAEPPVDAAPFMGRRDAAWRYYRCGDDHFVDLTTVAPSLSYARGFAYAQVTVSQTQAVSLLLASYGPADVWINGQHAGRVEHVDRQRPRRATLSATLNEGANDLLVRFEAAGIGDVPCALALRLDGAADAHIQLPTTIEPDLLQRRQDLETLAYAGTLDRYVYGYFDGDRYDKNEPIELRFPPDLNLTGELTFRLQSLQGDIFQERTPKVSAGAVVPLARTFPLRAGPHHLAMTPTANDYYIKQLRFERKELFYVARTPYTVKAGATLKARRGEALDDASQRRGGSLFTEIAKMALGQMDKLDRKVLERAIRTIEASPIGAESVLLGGLLAVRRFGKKKPRLDREFRLAVEAVAARFDYGAVAGEGDPAQESRQLIGHACETLAGQLWPERTFEAAGLTGAQHRARGEAAALAWLRKRGAYGFAAWHSPAAVEAIVAALAVLIDLADSDAVRELSAVLLDKVLFGLAVNSFEGAYGAARGQADTASVLSARLEPTSGLQRLLWARGSFNEHVMGVVCLALCRAYEVPPVIAQIATAPVEAVWSRERHARPWPPSLNGPIEPPSPWAWSAETAAYKTRDFLLASTQDYQPGQPGRAEHVWQVTLGPDARVFVNHPANTSLDDAARPNFWAGNGVLPKVAQWGDVLIALHRLPDDDWLGYTHAYFPAAAFDEHVLDGQWAFARKGNAYLALRADNGLQFVTTGSSAYRELRSPGRENAWVCHMGQALLDGPFDDFRRKVLALDVACDHLAARVQTLRGDRLYLLWEGPLVINGEAQPLAPQRHIENPYCVADLPASTLEIVAENQGIRLTFE